MDEYAIVIITPIRSAFYKITKELNGRLCKENIFFDNADFTTNNRKKGLLICLPEGIAAQDAIFLFKNIDIIFLVMQEV